VTARSYAEVMGAWPYRFDWTDRRDHTHAGRVGPRLAGRRTKVGLLEPVGRPRVRRRGLGRAVSLAVLHALRAAGATAAVVCPRGDDGYPVPGRLYRAIGFRPGGRTVTYGKPSV
jgi:predicted N-acetyltransferase YhbS